jgi:type IV fimbrial biogenesis protein FimT
VLEPLNLPMKPAVTPAEANRANSANSAKGAHRPWAGRGFTLVELMIGLAVLAVLATLVVPSMGSALQRQRLRAAAEHLAADLTEARFEATRRGQALHVLPRSGANWCWTVARQPACACDEPAAQGSASCQLSRSSQADHAGVKLLQAQAVELTPGGTAAGPGHTPGAVQAALFEGQPGQQLRVVVTALGRSRVCAPAAPVPGVPSC